MPSIGLTRGDVGADLKARKLDARSEVGSLDTRKAVAESQRTGMIQEWAIRSKTWMTLSSNAS